MDDKEFRARLSRLPLIWTVVSYCGALLYGVGVATLAIAGSGTALNDYALVAREAGGMMLVFWAIFTLVWVRREE